MAVAGTARWTWIWPALAWAILLMTLVIGGGAVIYAAAGAALFGTVFAAVYHAEMVAHRVGEPFVAAIKAAQSDRLQTSLNLALGSALATIGLKIPAVAAVSIALDTGWSLGWMERSRDCWR